MTTKIQTQKTTRLQQGNAYMLGNILFESHVKDNITAILNDCIMTNDNLKLLVQQMIKNAFVSQQHQLGHYSEAGH